MLEEATGRECETIDEGVSPGEPDPAVGRRREGEEADDIGSSDWCLENDPWVAANGVIVLGEHEAGRRDDLQDGVHRRTEVAVGFEVGHESLSAIKADRVAIDITRPGEAAIDSGRRQPDRLRMMRVVVRFRPRLLREAYRR